VFFSVHSVALVGVEPRPVVAEAHVYTAQEASFRIVGLPDTAIREASARILSSMSASSIRRQNSTIVVNLAPADLRKQGSAYDLPMALAALGASGLAARARVVALGELALDGSLRSVRGGVGAAMVARDMEVPCLLPPGAATDAAVVVGADIRVVRSLAEALGVMGGTFEGGGLPDIPVVEEHQGRDLAVLRGQARPRRALEVAAAGGHHLLLSGPPGTGKTLLASCLPGILPPLTDEEALEVGLVWSASGMQRRSIRTPPFRDPHHSASRAALLGGGSGMPRAGEVSLAHRGVLFLDEFGEFPVTVLDGLRQPLESGSITIARTGITVRFPADVQVVAASNPCPCGFKGDNKISCTCSEAGIEKYRKRFSGPLMDRFDIRMVVESVDPDVMLGPEGESTADVRERVATARCRQIERGRLNRGLQREDLDEHDWDERGIRMLRAGMERGVLTGRGFDRVRRVARTIADLAGSDQVSEAHTAEALGLRAHL
jgi:magnesium chelatase family protein